MRSLSEPLRVNCGPNVPRPYICASDRKKLDVVERSFSWGQRELSGCGFVIFVLHSDVDVKWVPLVLWIIFR